MLDLQLSPQNSLYPQATDGYPQPLSITGVRGNPCFTFICICSRPGVSMAAR